MKLSITISLIAAMSAAADLTAQLQNNAQGGSSIEDAEAYPTMAQLMSQYGADYSWRSYKVETEDEYILTIFRITGDENGDEIEGQGSKGPLLLQHGVLTDYSTWFDGPSDETEPAIGVQLFKEGYDVWFGNIRGT